MKVTVFGTGYVGLVQAAIFADAGHNVLCVDINEDRINNLKKGIIPIHEPGLSDIVKRNLNEDRLEFTIDASAGVNHGEFQFIAVGTPPDEDGSADLQYVLNVATTIAQHMSEPKVIVNKSTVPVGTASKVEQTIIRNLEELGTDVDFDVVSNPEFLKEGSAVSDCKKPDRIILGTENQHTENKMRELYSPFNRNHDRIITMDVRSAEMTKYAANCMLATKISFMNEMSNIAEKVGADIEAVRQGIGSDTRIGYHFIYPGCGYGGSCFPKDVKALIKTSSDFGYESKILKSVENVNYEQKELLFTKIKSYFGDNLNGKTIALWGLSFKPNTDDMRDAPSRILIERLWQKGVTIKAFDPVAMQECQRIYGIRDNLILVGTKESALNEADALVIVTEWQQFKAPDFEEIRSRLRNPVIFDGRNIYDQPIISNYGLDYYSIGRPILAQGNNMPMEQQGAQSIA